MTDFIWLFFRGLIWGIILYLAAVTVISPVLLLFAFPGKGSCIEKLMELYSSFHTWWYEWF
jgi:hypothetical protein